MGFFQNSVRKISNTLAIATDWVLIVMGVLLIVIALWRIDVPVARYVVISGGVILSVIGSWYRYRRLRRQR